MDSMIDEKKKKELAKILGKLKKPVKILYFTQEAVCPTCREQNEIVKELTAISQKLRIEVYDFVKDSDKAIQYDINRIPATVVMAEKDFRIRFYGITAGYEFTECL